MITNRYRSTFFFFYAELKMTRRVVYVLVSNFLLFTADKQCARNSNLWFLNEAKKDIMMCFLPRTCYLVFKFLKLSKNSTNRNAGHSSKFSTVYVSKRKRNCRKLNLTSKLCEIDFSFLIVTTKAVA